MDIINVRVTPTNCQCYEPRYLAITKSGVVGGGNSRGLSFYLCIRRCEPIRNLEPMRLFEVEV